MPLIPIPVADDGGLDILSIMISRSYPGAILTLLLALPACAQETTGPRPAVADSALSYVPGASWRSAAPAVVGLDSARMRQIASDIAGSRYGAVDGVVVVRYGYVALEKYNNWPATRAHTMQSVSKSVTSLLYGIAAASAGSSIDRSVLELFPQYDVANNDARKRALTVRHLLSMRTSMDFYEQPYDGSPLDQLNRSTGDWVKLVLDRPMIGTPGTVWSYNSGGAIAIGGVVRALTNEKVEAFARRTLFAPIGVTGEFWYRSPYDSLPHTGGGLNLKATDLARIGYLVLRKGRWGSQQVVPEAWINASTQSYTRGAPVFFADYNAGYGYFWWVFPETRRGSDSGVIAASGSGGQWLFVVPSRDLVISFVATNGNGLELLYDVLAAVR